MLRRVRVVRTLALAVLLLIARTADAGDGVPTLTSPSDVETIPPHYARFLIEESGLLGFQLAWYYTHIDFSGEDVELTWSWSDWSRKLGTFPHFDTNGFYTNSIAHGLAGALEYQAARANGINVLDSTLVAFAGTALWEYVIEYRERPSLNDLVLNTAIGISVGEPLVQIGRALRKGRPSPARWLLAFGFAPFDVVDGALDKQLRLGEDPPALRDRVWAGARVAGLDNGSDRAELATGMEFELMNAPGYGRPGAFSGWTHVGASSALEVGLEVLTGGPDAGLVGARANTRTSLFGRCDQDVIDVPTGQRGWSRFIGADLGFDFNIRMMGDDWDKLAIFHIIGPELTYDWYLGPATLSWQLLGYPDFAMVQALVFGPLPPFSASMPPTSTLRSKGYYFGLGTTLESRLRLELHGWSAALAVRGHQYCSIDGLDRTEMSGIDDPHGVADQRAFGHVEVGVPLGRSGWGLALTGDLALRRGTWADEDRGLVETSAGVFLTVTP